MSDWAEEKAKFIEMPFSMKRQFYKTKNKQYVELNQIPSWEEYYRNNEARLKQQLQESKAAKTANKQFSPDVQLNKIVTLWQGDITFLEIDAIVNAANTKLLGGGGVDGAIHKAAGPSLLKECATLNGCPTGQSKITGGYCLPAKHVIHTVGPYGEKPALLKSCYKTSLELLIDNELTSIAYPCISTGVYHYPQEAAAKVALETVRDILEQNKSNVTKVIFTTFLPEDVEIYENLMQIYFPLE